MPQYLLRIPSLVISLTILKSVDLGCLSPDRLPIVLIFTDDFEPWKPNITALCISWHDLCPHCFLASLTFQFDIICDETILYPIRIQIPR